MAVAVEIPDPGRRGVANENRGEGFGERAGAVVAIVAVEPYGMAERLKHHVPVERLAGTFEPVRLLEDEIRIEPADLAAGVGEACGGDVQEPLLLPHHRIAAEMKDPLAWLQLERRIAERHLDDEDIGADRIHPFHEGVEIEPLCLVPCRIEVRSDDPEIGTHY